MTLRRRATVYVGAHERVPSLGVCEAGSREAPEPRLLDRMREALRLRRYSRRTEEAYIAWARRYILFHGKRHPAELGAPEVTGFLTSLVGEGRVAASTQNQALKQAVWRAGVPKRASPHALPHSFAPGQPEILGLAGCTAQACRLSRHSGKPNGSNGRRWKGARER